MSLRRRNLEEDIKWLKWPIAMCGLSALLSLAMWWAASYYRDQVQREEFNALNRLDLLNAQIREIEEAERIIVENIGVYNNMVRLGIMGEEDRVALLDDLAAIRDRYDLFPIAVDIEEQNNQAIPYTVEVDFPEEQIALRSSRMSLQVPLLHEGDLTRLLAALMTGDRLLVADHCAVNYALESEDAYLTLTRHLLASCDFYWYTLQREPYIDPSF